MNAYSGDWGGQEEFPFGYSSVGWMSPKTAIDLYITVTLHTITLSSATAAGIEAPFFAFTPRFEFSVADVSISHSMLDTQAYAEEVLPPTSPLPSLLILDLHDNVLTSFA